MHASCGLVELQGKDASDYTDYDLMENDGFSSRFCRVDMFILNKRCDVRVFLLAFLLLLAGCSSFFEEQPKGPWAITKQESRHCFSDLKSDRELKAIEGKVTLDSIYDRDAYFELLNIEDLPSPKEKAVIRKWSSKLERCYKIKSESYVYEPRNVAIWSAAADSEQLLLVSELSKGNLSYGEFAAKRLEVDTRYRSQIIRAIAADYKKPENMQQPRIKDSSKPSASPSSSCGWEGTQWVCRSL
jgi:hypothetical protein